MRNHGTTRIVSALLGLLGSLALLGLGGWLMYRSLWAGAPIVALAGGLLALLLTVALLRRMAKNARPLPMN